ncbi:MAG: PAS domain S-box protein [Cytophagales bacterium]|nr:PAS domain S-box protein [Cytophagales bacterium]
MKSFRLAEQTAEQLQRETEQATQFIEAIAQGKLDETKYIIPEQTTEQPSRLTRALLKMREEMQAIAAKEVQRQWASEGLAKFVDILRLGTQDLDLLYNSIISNLVKYVNANQGGLFIVNEEEAHEPFIEMVACYAYDRRKFLQKRIEIGEGLIGQAYLEKEPIQYNALPKNYSVISSGLGAESPSSLLIVPLKVNEKVVGLIELAAFQPFKDFQVDFICKLGENIASTISNAQVTKRTQHLLRLSQQQTEQLRTAEEEMRQNMEELQATQEEMRRKEAEMNGLFAAIDLTLCMVELDTEGNIKAVNHRFAELLGFTSSELLGRKLQLLFVASRKTGNFEQLWNAVSNGISQTGNYLFNGKASRQVWLQASFSPVKDSTGNIRKVLMLGQDISANKQAEIAFQRLSLVADNTDNAVIITDARGITEYVNRGFESMTGYKAEEIIGKKPGHVLQGPDTDPATVARISQKLKSKRPFSEDILNYRKDGTPYWISLTINPVFDEQGELSRFIAIQADITQTKLQALDLNGKMEAINRTNAIVEFDTQGNILTANENFLQLMEYSLEEIKGKHHSIFVLPKERNTEAYRNFWKELGKQVGFRSGEFERVTKSGRTVWLRGNYNTIVDHLGRPAKVIKIAQDITAEKVLLAEIQQQNEEIKTQEEELRQNLEELMSIQEALQAKQREAEAIAQKFNNILEGCADAVITIDKHGIINFFNEAAEKLWGYQRSEVIGKNVKILMFEEHASQHDRYIQNYETTRQRKVIGIGREVEARRKDGSKVPILLTLSESEFNGESLYTAFIKDITKQKALEQQTQQQIEELRTQEEEIRQNLEELQANQEEIQRTVMNLNGLMAAIETTMATVEFDMDGLVIDANNNFLATMGYRLDEVIGKPHRLFVDAKQANSPEYLKFWDNLRLGRPYQGEVKRIAKSGEEKWFSASYMPVTDRHGKPVKIIKLAREITQQKLINLDISGQLEAIRRSFAVATFDMNGHLIEANENFLDLLGYGINEIIGRHHKLFMGKAEADTNEYAVFWSCLRSGKAQEGEFVLFNKSGEEIIVRGSYNPILNLDGEPYKVMAYLQQLLIRQNGRLRSKTTTASTAEGEEAG